MWWQEAVSLSELNGTETADSLKRETVWCDRRRQRKAVNQLRFHATTPTTGRVLLARKISIVAVLYRKVQGRCVCVWWKDGGHGVKSRAEVGPVVVLSAAS